MKATIDFDENLYRRLKIEAARSGRTVRELVAEGVRYVLDGEPSASAEVAADSADARPAWFGMLREYGDRIDDHSMAAVRQSIAKGRAGSADKP